MGLASNTVNSVKSQAPGLTQTSRSKDLHLATNTGSNYESSDGEEFNPPSSKKIKPVDGLILKTPIAFQKDSDPDMIPIRKEGMAVCEKCGAIGVKHSFYTKERRFCSQACAKSFSETSHLNLGVQEKKAIMPPVSQVASTKKSGQPLEDVHVFSNKKRLQAAKEAQNPSQDKYGFDWVEMLMEPGFVTPSISCFRHAPLSDTWASDVSIGMKVEVENTDTRQASINGDPQSYWVASVISIMGYKARLRYEGFGDDNAKDFWVNLAAEDVHPVGWCASKGKPLIPPRTIQDKYTEWREFLVKRLTGARSLPNQYHARVIEACRSRFKVGMTLELIDRNRLSTMKVATIDMILGRRLRLKYIDAQPDEAGFWCHEESNLIHPVGWAQTVGHEIDAPQDYAERCAKKAFLPTDATPDLFPELKQTTSTTHKFKEGMKLEAVDPLNLDSICVATIVKVLRHGYLMIRIDRPDESDPDDSGHFCYHASSSCIAPPGFCEANAITLKSPEDYEGRFRWGDYLRQTKSSATPEILFGNRDVPPSQQLRVGMRVEAADLMDPRLVCVATVAQVAGRLVRIHFDGWSDDFDQWMDIASPEIYPVGWCELAGYRLEPPVVPVPVPTVKRGRKTGRGGRGRRGGRGGRASTGAGSQQAGVKRERSPSSDSPKSGSRGKATKLSLPSGRKSVESLRTLRPRSSQQNSDTSLDETSLDNQVGPANKAKVQPVESEPAATSAGTSATKPSLTLSNSVPAAQKPVTEAAPAAGGSVRKIPRLIDVSASTRREALAGVQPLDWTTEDVAQFLRVNDYTAYCEAFTKSLVDGRTLLSLNKDQVLKLTDMKLGPSVKILDLITQLKTRVNPSGLARQSSANIQATGQSSQR